MMDPAKRPLGLCLAAAAAVLLAPVTLAAEDDPASVLLSGLAEDAAVLPEMPAEQHDERSRVIRQILDEYFDVPLVSRAVVGRHWRTMTDVQRTDFQRAFAIHTTDLFEGQIDRIAGGTLTILRSVPRSERETVVYSIFGREGEDPLEVQWRFRKRSEDGDLRIVDVAVEGLSLLTTQRQDFAAILEAEGVDALIRTLVAMNEAPD